MPGQESRHSSLLSPLITAVSRVLGGYSWLLIILPSQLSGFFFLVSLLFCQKLWREEMEKEVYDCNNGWKNEIIFCITNEILFLSNFLLFLLGGA